jgi:hypothetical protein
MVQMKAGARRNGHAGVFAASDIARSTANFMSSNNSFSKRSASLVVAASHVSFIRRSNVLIGMES